MNQSKNGRSFEDFVTMEDKKRSGSTEHQRYKRKMWQAVSATLLFGASCGVAANTAENGPAHIATGIGLAASSVAVTCHAYKTDRSNRTPSRDSGQAFKPER